MTALLSLAICNIGRMNRLLTMPKLMEEKKWITTEQMLEDLKNDANHEAWISRASTYGEKLQYHLGSTAVPSARYCCTSSKVLEFLPIKTAVFAARY